MTVLVTVFAYGLQLGALLFLPALLFFCLRSYVQKKTAVMASLLCALLIIAAATWLAFHPIRSCPEALKPYLTEDRWQDILSATPPIYNPHLPFFPWKVTVEHADENVLYWRTDWFPIGTTRTGVTPDGYDPVHGLSG